MSIHAPPPTLPSSPESSTAAAGRVLVVDDDPTMRLLARAELEAAGYQVLEAGDGAGALAATAAHAPDLVLMDVEMPVLGGCAACAALRRLPHGRRLPVVMMTALDDDASIERAFEAGATDFAIKPVNWVVMAHRLRYLMRASTAIDALAQSQQRLSNAQRLGATGDWEWHAAEDRVQGSEQAVHLLGHADDRATFTFSSFFAGVLADDAAGWERACRRALTDGQPFSLELRVRAPDGALRHLHQHVQVGEFDARGRPARLAGAVHDVTRQRHAEAEIRRLAHYDALTGLPNRQLFTEQLRAAVARAERRRSRVAVMAVDLDQFRRVNDTLGHTQGDELLRAAADRLAASLRGYDGVSRTSGERDDAVARLGGDEFLVLVSDVDRSTDVAAIAQRLVRSLGQPLVLQGNEVCVGGTIGVAMYPEDGADVETLLKHADTALHRAKTSCRGAFQFYDPSMNARALDRLTIEARLRRALERDEFVLHFQPRIDVVGGHLVGAEALIRWQHPERGLVPPGEFIPLVEEVGLVVPIGEWVIRAACRQSAAWRSAGLGVVPVAVNLSSTHLHDRALPSVVAAAMHQHGVPPHGLELEVTESILLADSADSRVVVDALDLMGVQLSIDDFGTGYSSLSYLKRLPIASLKIDRSFVRDLVTDPDDEAIVSAIIALAHSLKLRVVAEGVETEAQLAMLRDRRCDEYQGYLTSRPVDGAEFVRVVRTRLPRAAALSAARQPATPVPRPAPV